jgi:hypothetical protein
LRGEFVVADVNIADVPAHPDLVRFDPKFGQKFIVTVDTEEEFDWSAPIDRHRHSTKTIPDLTRFQQFCESFGVVPIYLVDYPIAASPQAAEILGPAAVGGRCEIGMQLHPWVNPPFNEEVNPFNSFAGNLPAELEQAKFQSLHDAISANFGVDPLIYRAGRYGTGPHTCRILRDAGIAIDTSVRSRFDYSSGGGPNYRTHPQHPYWLDEREGVMELPLTTVFWGPLRQQGDWLYPRLWRTPRLRGALSRLGLLERIPLTPEGTTVDEALRGIDIALDDQLPILVFSFHSPSLAPGYTPYVRDERDLELFYDWWRQVFTYLNQRKVAATSVKDILSAPMLA